MINPQSLVNVLYCESSADGTIGGSHYCLLYLVENLDRSRFTPVVGFYEEHALLSQFRGTAETVIFEQDSPVRWGEAAVGPFAWISKVARRTVNFFKFLQTVARNAGFLRGRRIGLLHLNNSITRHQNWMLAALIARVPYVVHERGLSPSYTRLDRFYARRAQLVIPMSRWIREHMLACGVPGHNITVMYDGLDPDRLKVSCTPEELRQAWNVAPDRPVVGIVGNIRWWKGQETVVRAVAEVVKTHPRLVCFFVGAATAEDQAFQNDLRRLIDEFGIQDNVRFTGYQKEVPSFVNMMPFVIHASIAPEPFGMVVLEAMAQRKAVIGSRAGGVIEMVVEGETGYTFVSGDAQGLAARMVELLDDPVKAQQMGEAGYRRLVNEFTIERYMTEIHSAYQSILSRRFTPARIAAAASGN